VTETREPYPRLLTVREAARAARVSPPTMYRRNGAGDVPGAIRVGEGSGPIRLIEHEFGRWLLGEGTR